MRNTQWRMASSSLSCTTLSTKSSSGASFISTAVARMTWWMDGHSLISPGLRHHATCPQRNHCQAPALTSSKAKSLLRGGSTPGNRSFSRPMKMTISWVWECQQMQYAFEKTEAYVHIPSSVPDASRT